MDHIYQYTFKETPRTASLALFPQRGSRIKLLESKGHKNQIRFVPYLNYLIFYTVRGPDVLVLHITGPGQDWIGLLA